MTSVESKTNPVLVDLVHDLKKMSWTHEAPIWRDIAKRLEKPTKRRVEVNLSRLSRHLGDGEVALVPGKVLAAGSVNKKMTVAAYAFSEQAREKVKAAGGECLTIRQLAERNPKGQKVRILG